MSGVQVPSNVKQIGTIGDGMRVYVEDYVYSYLSQYAQAGGYEERLAVLVGRCVSIDGQRVLFINGAVQGKYCERDRGILIFSDKSIAYAREMIEAYFPGSEIVGWMQTQPSYGTFLNSSYAAYHKDAFQKDYHVLFVVDPVEGANAFYTYEEDMSDLREAKGYFIYYDKNPSMHEYMLENKATEPPRPLPEEAVRKSNREASEPRYRYNRAAELADQRLRGRAAKPSQADPRRTMNLVASLCAVLVILCFIMGAGLVQNQNRISAMEQQIVQLSTSYRNLAAYKMLDLYQGTARPGEALTASYSADLIWQLYKHTHR